MTRRRHRTTAWLAGGATLVAASFGGCGDSDGGSAGEGSSDGKPSPFAVGEAVPEGFELAIAGNGHHDRAWGSDSLGNDGAVTVVAPDGDPTDPGAVQIEPTGFEGYQGGLDQAVVGSSEPLEVDGEEALFVPADQGDGNPGSSVPAQLVAVRGPDMAISLTAEEATQEELLAVLATVETPSDQMSAPMVPDPPAGYEVVGSLDADGVLAVDPVLPREDDDDVSGPVGARVVAWLRDPLPPEPDSGYTPGPDVLMMLAVPADSIDPGALAGPVPGLPVPDDYEQVSAEGRDGAVATYPEHDIDDPARRVVLDTPWGDQLVVIASGERLPDADALVDLAASVEQVDIGEWEDFVASTR